MFKVRLHFVQRILFKVTAAIMIFGFIMWLGGLMIQNIHLAIFGAKVTMISFWLAATSDLLEYLGGRNNE